jgi:CopG family nickel-responsive transcriptional regulator
MTIVSVSMDEELLQDVEEIQRNLRFSGRSEVIRSAVRMFSADLNEKRALTGPLNCICLVTHDEDAEDVVTEVKHGFNRIIETHIHSKLGAGGCLEILVLKGDAKEVRELFRVFQTSRRIDQVRLILP